MFRSIASLGVVKIVLLSLGVSSIASAQGAMPQHVFKRGELEILVVDDVYHDRSEMVYRLVEERTGRKFTLKFETPPGLSKDQAPPAQPRGEWRTGDFVQVEGVVGASTDDLYVLASGGEEVKVLEKYAFSTGARNVAVLLVNFKDASVDCTVNQVANFVFDNPNAGAGQRSVAEYFADTSFGQISMPRDTNNDNQADVFGPFKINYSVSGNCDYDGWAAAARSAASNSGVNLSKYQHVVLVLPRNVPCGWVGLGHLGCSSTCNTWITWCDTPDLYAHELGHNLGMHHASTDLNNDGKPDNEYGDRSDPMGWAGIGYRHNNAPHKVQVGWFDSYSNRVTTITQAGRYYIAPLELNPGAATLPQVLVIDKPNSNESYYLSFRTNGQAYNDSMPTDYQNGLNIHRYAGSGMVNTYFIDSLKDGEVFVDSANDLSISQFAHDPHQIDGFVAVDIAFGCTPLKPSTSLSPSGNTVVASGTTVDYVVSVTNREGSNCSPATFNLSPVVPSGWSASVTSSQLSVGPGKTASTTLRVTSPSNASPGTYNVKVEVKDTTGARATVYPTSSYEVLNVSNQPPEAITTLTGKATSEGYVSLSWTPPFDDSGFIEFYRVYHDSGDGFVFTGKSTSTTFTDRDAVPGANQYYVTAVDAQLDVSPKSNIVTVTIGSGGEGEPAPVLDIAASVSDGNVFLTWAPSAGAAFYRLYHGTGDGFSYVGKIFETSYKHTEAKTGSNFYHVIAVDSDKNTSQRGTILEVVISTAASEPPEPVTSLTASTTIDGDVFLNWKRSRDDSGYASFYRVYRDKGTGFSYIGKITATSYTDASPGSALNRYHIIAVDDEKNKSRLGNIAEVDLSTSASNSPEKVETLSANLNGDGTVTLTWQAASAGSTYADYYRVYHADDGGGDYSFSYIGKRSGTRFKHSNPPKGRNKYYVIALMDDGTKSERGNIATVVK